MMGYIPGHCLPLVCLQILTSFGDILESRHLSIQIDPFTLTK